MTLPNDEDLAALLADATPGPSFRETRADIALKRLGPDLARAVLDLRAEVARLTAERDAAHRAGMLEAADMADEFGEGLSGIGADIRAAAEGAP